MMTAIVTLTINPAIDLSTSVDHVVPVLKLRCAGLRRDPGGGGINVARVVRRMGSEVTAIYTAGGSIGRLLRSLVEHEGIESVALQISAETREDFTVHENSTGQQFRFVLAGPHLVDGEWQGLLKLVSSLDPFPHYLVASGSLPPGVPDDFYRRIARLAHDRQARLVLDTSGPALQEALAEGAYLIKPNLNELSMLIGAHPAADEDAVDACRRIIAGGQAEIVALTLGNRGALLASRDAIWRAPPLPIEPISAVGAGDSFLGGIIWSLAAGHALDEAFRYGVAAGTAALLSPGTELCHPVDVDRLYRMVDLVRN
jgi:6-phosphofructokinase 2